MKNQGIKWEQRQPSGRKMLGSTKGCNKHTISQWREKGRTFSFRGLLVAVLCVDYLLFTFTFSGARREQSSVESSQKKTSLPDKCLGAGWLAYKVTGVGNG